MALTREARGRGVDVRGPEMLGTLATRPPLLEDFQFVKFRLEGEVAHLRLDRPQQNLLNERMLMEIASGINSVSEKREVIAGSESEVPMTMNARTRGTRHGRAINDRRKSLRV